LQQTPSTHCPEAHWEVAVQLCPFVLGSASKIAKISALPPTVNVQAVDMPEQLPPQPRNVSPGPGTALMVTVVPATNEPVAVVHAAPQEIAEGTDVTAPALPYFRTVMVLRVPIGSLSTAALFVPFVSLTPPGTATVAVFVIVPEPEPETALPNT